MNIKRGGYNRTDSSAHRPPEKDLPQRPSAAVVRLPPFEWPCLNAACSNVSIQVCMTYSKVGGRTSGYRLLMFEC